MVSAHDSGASGPGLELWPGTLCCALRQDTLLSHCLTPPRCINEHQRIIQATCQKTFGKWRGGKGNQGWTIPSRDSRNTPSRLHITETRPTTGLLRPNPHHTFEYAALILRLGLLIRHTTRHSNPSQKRSFSKPEEFERQLWDFVWTENILKTELFENDDVTIIT